MVFKSNVHSIKIKIIQHYYTQKITPKITGRDILTSRGFTKYCVQEISKSLENLKIFHLLSIIGKKHLPTIYINLKNTSLTINMITVEFIVKINS